MAPEFRVSAPEEMVAPLRSPTRPPLLTIVLPRTPQDDTISLAPDRTSTPAIVCPEPTPSVKPEPSCRVPPDDTVAPPPNDAPACSNTTPPLVIVGATSEPPLCTIKRPPLLTAVPLAEPPASTVSDPAKTLAPLSTPPDET